MDQKPKEKDVKPAHVEPQQQFVLFLAGLFRDVLLGWQGMTDAERQVGEYVLQNMNPDDQLKWKENAQNMSRRVQTVAEGFVQAIAVTSARIQL